MAKRKTAQQREALQLLYQARDLVRGQPRSAILTAIDLIEDQGDLALTSFHYDAMQPGESLVCPKYSGLMMRCGKQSGRTWFFRTTDPASMRQVHIRIGDYPKVSISQAREIRADLIEQRKAGKLPVVRSALGGAAAKTVGDLCDWYVTEYCKTKRPASVRDDESTIELYIRPKFGKVALTDWSASEISAHVQELFNSTEKGRQAEKVRTVLSAMNNAARGRSKRWAGSVEWLEGIPNPMPHVAQLPRRGGTLKAKTNYKPRLPEMIRYARGLEKLRQPYADCLTLQLLTCARIGEVAELPWGEIDLEERVWVLPAARAKNKTDHIVQLVPRAVDLLAARRRSDPEAAWVFQSLKYPGHHVSKDTLERVISGNRELLGVDARFTSHCIRHGCLSWMASNEIGREVRDAVSNHLPPPGVDREYVDAELSGPARRALERWERALFPAAGQVVQLAGHSK